MALSANSNICDNSFFVFFFFKKIGQTAATYLICRFTCSTPMVYLQGITFFFIIRNCGVAVFPQSHDLTPDVPNKVMVSEIDANLKEYVIL